MKKTAYILSVVLLAWLMMGATTLFNLTTQFAGILPLANGGTGYNQTVTALTPGTTVALDASLGPVYTLTPAQAETINGSNCTSGRHFNVIITTSGTSSFVLTFSANFKAAGTLATGTSTAKVFQVSFMCNGTTAVEEGRTAAM
jgi:hypothetical protein